MANEVFQLNITRLSVDEILDMFLQLGDLYDSDLMRHDRTYRIDQLLAQFYGGYYDITAIMKRLTPDCTKLLQRCLFHNEERTCSEIFQFRKTQDGFCCTFNYATKGDDLLLRHGFDHKLDPLKVEYLGEDRGLVVLMDLSINDYFYPIFPITGCKVNIFNPHDYPDVSSGGVIEILVSPTRQVKVAVEAIVAYSTPNILAYSLEHRYCVFSEEMESVRSSYTYSDCIVDCRIADILRLCKCVPFFLPNRGEKYNLLINNYLISWMNSFYSKIVTVPQDFRVESKRVCDLDDVPCLTKHKYKWYSVVPNTDLYDGEIQESDEVLHCKNCYPLCNDVNYNAKMSDTYLPRAQHTSKILNGMKFENQSVLYVYFSSFGTIKLRQDVVYRWYELLGDASGIGGIFLGFSLIAVVEFAYFVGLFVLELLKGPDSSDRAKDESGRKRAAIQTIYWGELYPRTRPGVIADQRDRRRDKD
ncbi:PREDICTED: sodium channel protein Nach-like [Dufourea novaeangliae]|uniref:sodium channel protein Nach-like n=1 Tax=Dufourea novaeangliae TaxID=178035 RepID=UPI000767664D|nr:PREDICTED: sodium channel protein Nach-like [Dufourea novaeangliae]